MSEYKKCGSIELWRFIACISIVVFHFEWIYIGSPVYLQHFYIWVEFFFILSGFFLGKNVLDNKETNYAEHKFSSLNYLKTSVKKLYPLYILAFVISFISMSIINDWDFMQNVSALFSAKWEILMLQMSGFDLNAIVINGTTAYISALLFASLIIHYILENHFKMFINILGPILCIGSYAYIINHYGNLSQWTAFNGWVCAGVIRALGGISVGVITYVVIRVYLEKLSTLLLNFIYAICSLCCVLLIVCRNNISYVDEIIYIPIFSLIIGAVYIKSQRNKIKYDLLNDIFIYLGNLSYPIYLIHYSILYLFKHYLEGIRYEIIILPILLVVILVSITLSFIVSLLKKVNLNKRCL